MQIGELELVNPEKVDRAINGSVASNGQLMGGVGPGDKDKILVEYDRLGGYIKKGKYKVKSGCFYDHRTKKAVPKPEIFLLLRDLNGNEVELPDGEAIPVEVRAAEVQAETKAKAKKAKKEDETDEDEE